MNIFALCEDPVVAARLHLDKHVVKMPLETAQMLSTINGGPYKPTHAKHPCTVWASTSTENYAWLVQLGLALCAEYTYRYGKVHKCQAIIESLRDAPVAVPSGPLAAFAQAMPEECKAADAVLAYQTYYREYKSYIGVWTKRSRPAFMTEKAELMDDVNKYIKEKK